MKAKQRIQAASFGPEALKVITRAFDEAWASVASHFSGDAVSTDAARLRLADAVLANAHEDSRDVQALKEAALQSMAMADARLKRL